MSKTKNKPVAKKGDGAQVAAMRAKGFIPALEAAALAMTHITTLYDWAHKGLVKHVKVGNRYYIEEASLKTALGPLAT